MPAAGVLALAARCRAAPLVRDDFCADLGPDLAAVILRAADARHSYPSLNVGGWKSGEDFFLWDDAAVQELRQRIAAQVGDHLVGWAMVNRDGSWHPRHQHRAAVLAGVCYVAIPPEAPPTVFEFPGGELTIEARLGRLVVVRGDTWHRVPAHAGREPRVTVAFDVR